MPDLSRLAARAAITEKSERTALAEGGRLTGDARLTDDYHDLLNAVLELLEDSGVPLPDPDSVETARAAWL